MTILYRRCFLNTYLIDGLVWFFWFWVLMRFSETRDWTTYFWAFLSLFYLGAYSYFRHYGYLTLDNGFVKISGPFGNKISHGNLTEVSCFAGDYILTSERQKLTINNQYENRRPCGPPRPKA